MPPRAPPLVVIAGPCQLETLDHALMIGERMAEACRRAGAGFVFKASYDKANRTKMRHVDLATRFEGLEVENASTLRKR